MVEYCDEIFKFLKDFRRKIKYQFSGKCNPWEQICFVEQNEGQTGGQRTEKMTKFVTAFRNYSIALLKDYFIYIYIYILLSY